MSSSAKMYEAKGHMGAEMATPSSPPSAPSVRGDASAGSASDTSSASNPVTEPGALVRQIMYSAQLSMSVHDADFAVRRAEELATNVGGWVQSVQGTQIAMRVPAKRLREIMHTIESWGRVLERSYFSEDVSAEYYDLETRIAVLRKTQAALFELLEKSASVDDALKVRARLDQVTQELEQALGRQRQLQELVAFSRIDLRFSDETGMPRKVDAEDPFPWVDTLGVEVTRW